VLGLLLPGVVGSFLGGHILAPIAGVPTYVTVGNAHAQKHALIAFSDTFGGRAQSLFDVMATCCLLTAVLDSVGILDHTTSPIDLATTLSVLFIYPSYTILSRAPLACASRVRLSYAPLARARGRRKAPLDRALHWIEVVSLLALLSFLMFVLTRDA
jgi:hypothetical protein